MSCHTHHTPPILPVRVHWPHVASGCPPCCSCGHTPHTRGGFVAAVGPAAVAPAAVGAATVAAFQPPRPWKRRWLPQERTEAPVEVGRGGQRPPVATSAQTGRGHVTPCTLQVTSALWSADLSWTLPSILSVKHKAVKLLIKYLLFTLQEESFQMKHYTVFKNLTNGIEKRLKTMHVTNMTLRRNKREATE